MNFAKLTVHDVDDAEQEQWINLELVRYLKVITKRQNGTKYTFTRLYFDKDNAVDVTETPAGVITGAFAVVRA